MNNYVNIKFSHYIIKIHISDASNLIRKFFLFSILQYFIQIHPSPNRYVMIVDRRVDCIGFGV
jgi:hypothetical protein